MRQSSTSLAVLACLLALHAQAQPQPVQRREIGNQVLENVPETPPEVREALRRYQNARTAAFQDWLPDGSMLILTRFGSTNQLHRVAAPGADRSQITFFDEPVAGARCVPGSERFVTRRDRGGDEWFQLYLADRSGRELLLTEPGTRNQSVAFSPDGRIMVWARQAKGDSNADILIAEPAQPSSRRVLLEGEGAMMTLDVAADGKTVLLGREISAASSKRFLLDVASGRLTEIAPSPESIAYGGGEFTAEGRSVILLSDRGSDTKRVVELDLATGQESVLTPGLAWNVERFDLSDDGRLLAYSVNEDGYSRVAVRELRGQAALPQPELPGGVIGALDFTADGERLAIALSTPTSAGDVWSWDVRGGKLELWTFSELGGLDPADMVAPQLVRFESFDGLSVPAFIYRPRAKGTPVIVQIHGGPESQTRPSFNAAIQYFVAELGAAVLLPNVRGSDGYGKRYLAMDNAEKREDSVRDIGALLDWIRSQPDLDAERVVVYGGSYGGYMVLASMIHYSDRLAGGMESYGISNFVSFLENTEAYRRDLRRAEYGDERNPEMRKVFERISPLGNIKRIGKPMLVMQGANDPRVPQSESDQVVRELRANGIETWYLVFKDEGHGFHKQVNSDRRREAETLFLRKVFRMEPAG
jgi:dipeptidyl aminopeptidase/acylaminoacyl peptidase